jgi:hypothetical protein
MERQRRRRRHHRRKRWIKRGIQLVVALSVAVVLGFWIYKISMPVSISPPPFEQAEEFDVNQSFANNFPVSNQKSKTSRPLYPYSVVDGGVQSVKELRQACDRDALVAGHYAGLDWKQAKVIEVKSPLKGFVSYRRDNKIYWTKKQHMVAAGEKVITDGVLLSRSRCGNQIAMTLQKPTSTTEPSEEELNKTIELDPMELMMSGLDAPYLLESDFDMPWPRMPEKKIAFTPLRSRFENYHAPIKTQGFPPRGFAPLPPTSVPEPSTWLLLSSGLGGIWLWRRKEKS